MYCCQFKQHFEIIRDKTRYDWVCMVSLFRYSNLTCYDDATVIKKTEKKNTKNIIKHPWTQPKASLHQVLLKAQKNVNIWDSIVDLFTHVNINPIAIMNRIPCTIWISFGLSSVLIKSLKFLETEKAMISLSICWVVIGREILNYSVITWSWFINAYSYFFQSLSNRRWFRRHKRSAKMRKLFCKF